LERDFAAEEAAATLLDSASLFDEETVEDGVEEPVAGVPNFSISTPRAMATLSYKMTPEEIRTAEGEMHEAYAADDKEAMVEVVAKYRQRGMHRGNITLRKLEDRVQQMEDAELDLVGEDDNAAMAPAGRPGEPAGKRRSPPREVNHRPVATPQGGASLGGPGGSQPTAGVGAGLQQTAGVGTVLPQEQPLWAKALVDSAASSAADRVQGTLTQAIAKLDLRTRHLEEKQNAAEKKLIQTEVRVAEVEKFGDRISALESAQLTCKQEAIEAAKTAARVVPTGGSGYGSGNQQSFMPSNFSIKGACEYALVSTEGFTKAFADDLLNRLKSTLPPTIASEIGRHEVKGLDLSGARGYAVEVAVRDKEKVRTVMSMVARLLKEDDSFRYLPEGQAAGQERRLYAVEERSESDRIRYRALGRAKDKITKLRVGLGTAAVGELSFNWKPRFSVEDEDGEVLCSIRENGSVFADEQLAQKYLGVGARELRKLIVGTV